MLAIFFLKFNPMGKYLSVLVVLVLLASPVLSQDVLLKQLREEILNHDFDGPQIMHFYKMAHDVENPSPVLLAYQAVSEAFMARVEWNPYSKITRLKTSESLFKKALSLDSNNLEIRFLRFSTQAGIPSFLGFSKDIKSDKDKIINNIDSIDRLGIDESLRNFIITFLSDSKYCSAEDLEILRKKKKKV